MIKYCFFTIAFISSAIMVCQSKEEEYYNILSIDGGGIRGIISATCLAKIEAYAY